MDKINGNTLDYVEADRKEAMAIMLMQHYYGEYCHNLMESYEWTWVGQDGKVQYRKQYDVYQERAMNNSNLIYNYLQVKYLRHIDN